MTYRELRQVLTEVDNQQMTVKELRDLLFEIENQDKVIEDNDILRLTFGK
ncbi:MAG: hypothetical protein LIO41_07495 [Ruminococcus sp.]|nr:hypothetical protein [Oscillospiraceae bacterium]MCC8192861.1 hypothetical protein [Ruminococcus sp.]